MQTQAVAEGLAINIISKENHKVDKLTTIWNNPENIGSFDQQKDSSNWDYYRWANQQPDWQNRYGGTVSPITGTTEGTTEVPV